MSTDCGSSTGGETRPARPADLPAILRWERDYMRSVEPAAEGAWTQAIDRNLELWVSCLDRTLILEVAGEPAGSMMWMANGDSATLVGIHVVPDQRRRGFGSLLLESFARHARQAGYGLLALGVHRDNPAIGLYEANGYRRTGEDGSYILFTRSSDQGFPACRP